MRGLSAAKKFHDENTGLGYFPFKIKPGEDPKTVRVLVGAEPELDPETQEPIPGKPFIESLFMHSEFKVLKPVRCVCQESTKDELNCPLCRVGAPRTLRTFIPVRVRGDEVKERVQIIEYGRDNLTEVQSAVEELAESGVEDADITKIDFKIKRMGKGTDTTYKWVALPATVRPLNAEELALAVPVMSDVIAVKDIDELEKLAVQFERAKNATEVPSDDEKDEEIPF